MLSRQQGERGNRISSTGQGLYFRHCACALPLLCSAVLRAFSKQTQIVGHMSGVMKFTLNVHTAPHSIRSMPQAVGLAASRSQTQFLT